MFKFPRTITIRCIQVRVCHSDRSLVGLVSVSNVRAKKSYRLEPNMKSILKRLRMLLTVDEIKAYSIYDRFPSIRSIDMMSTVGNNIEILMKNGITSETIIDNPFLIVMNEG